MNNEKPQDFDDEIDLKELFLILWNKKYLIMFITTSAAIIAILYSLSLSNIYSSSTLLAPATSEDSLTSKLGGYSSLAGFAGISLPSEPGGKSAEAMERIKSYDFFVEHFLPNILFENLVAAKDWNQISNTIDYDNKIFDKVNNKWVRDFQYPMLAKPSNQEAYRIYRDIVTISEDQKTYFVSINIKHVSPFIAQKWLKLIITNINSHMRDLDKTLARNSINFLNSSLLKTNLAEIKIVISNLVRGQMQILTLAESNVDYVFKPISSPIASEQKSGPSRSMICILGTILGFIFSLFISLALHYSNFRKS